MFIEVRYWIGHSRYSISWRMGRHKSTTHRLIMVLESSRYVERDASTGKYRLGSRILELGLSALSKLDVYEVARPYLRELVRETGETSHIGVLRDGEIISIVNVESTQSIRTPSTVGTRHPAHSSALGKSILAFSPAEDVEAFLAQSVLEAFTQNTLHSRAQFIAEMEAVRQAGYAIDDEEWEEGLRCIGAPVRSSSGEVIASIAIAGPAFRLTRERLEILSKAVVEAADRVSADLGFRQQFVTTSHRS